MSTETDAVIKDGLIIRNGAVTGRTKMERRVEIPEGVTEIRSGAFRENVVLEEISIPASVKVIGAWAFEKCEKLKKVVFAGGVEVIEQYAFSGCAWLQTARLPKTLKVIGISAFDGCERLKKIDLPEGLEKVEIYAFSGCRSLKKLKLPASVTHFGGGFSLCKKLEKVEVLGTFDVNRYTFQYGRPTLILPQVHLSALESCNKVQAVLGFAQAAERGLEYDPEIRAEYLKYSRASERICFLTLSRVTRFCGFCSRKSCFR